MGENDIIYNNEYVRGFGCMEDFLASDSGWASSDKRLKAILINARSLRGKMDDLLNIVSTLGDLDCSH